MKNRRSWPLGLATVALATLAWTAVMDPSGRRRGAHDRMTGAVVVDVRPQPEPEEEVDERPRHIVNLTAMRLMPSPQQQSVEPPASVPAPAPEPTPQPVPEPVAPAPGRHAAPPAAAAPAPDPAAPAPVAPSPSARPVHDYPPPPPSAVPGQPIATQPALNSTGGFSFVLAAMKAFLEHGVELKIVEDHDPDALVPGWRG